MCIHMYVWSVFMYFTVLCIHVHTYVCMVSVYVFYRFVHTCVYICMYGQCLCLHSEKAGFYIIGDAIICQNKRNYLMSAV